MADNARKIKVRFTQQQLQLLDSLKNQGKFGERYEDIILNVFREHIDYINKFPGYIKQRFGQGGL